MSRVFVILIITVFAGLGLFAFSGQISSGRSLPIENEQDVTKIPDVIVLGQDSALGKVTFNHVSHNGGKYSIDGTGPIACIECHHTAQPASELAKHPPLTTAWPADRTTTLTADLFNKDPKAAGVAACRDCHARASATPKLMPKIPAVKHEGSTALITLTNQQALHRNCAGCHTEISKQNKAVKGPTNMQCTACHKKG